MPTDDEATARWVALTAPWHPALLAKSEALPRVEDEASSPESGDLIVVADGSIGRLDRDDRERAVDAGIPIVEATRDRAATIAAMLGHAGAVPGDSSGETADLAADFPHPVFLLFWVMHIGTVWAAVHLTWTRGIHPDWRRYRLAVAVTAVWAASVFCLNVALDSKYGYLNAKPGSATALDLLGPWPWYVLAEVAIIAVVWALMTWPWVRRPASAAAAP